jgi:endoglucanase
MRNVLTQTLTVCATACTLTFVAGCQSNDHASAPASAQPAPAAATPPATPSVAPAPAATKSVVRIKAGVSAAFTDSSGNVWQPDQGFDGGDVISRDPGTAIANTKDAALYLSEHYGMSSFSCSVPNGKYIAKLHFAETFEGVTGPGERVFSYNVQGHDFKNFDIFVKAGGSNRAYIETVPVEVTNGKFTIAFTSIVENPEINAIELVPQP